MATAFTARFLRDKNDSAVDMEEGFVREWIRWATGEHEEYFTSLPASCRHCISHL